jgi:type II secretory pathway pseudopilin PulG
MMRILVNRGGQQLGPFSLDELRAALGTGQISQKDLAWWDGAPAWVPVSQVPGLGVATLPIPSLPGSRQDPASGLATASLVLGILSLGLTCLAGIPAIICGHMALARQRRAGYTGSGVAIAGLITGYAGTVLIGMIALLVSIAIPVYGQAQERAKLVKSLNNVQKIVEACESYQMAHNEFPPSLDALGEFAPPPAVFQDPLSPEHGNDGYWYSKPARNAPGNTVVVASRGQSHDKKRRRALGHKDGSATIGPFDLPMKR